MGTVDDHQILKFTQECSQVEARSAAQVQTEISFSLPSDRLDTDRPETELALSLPYRKRGNQMVDVDAPMAEAGTQCRLQ